MTAAADPVDDWLEAFAAFERDLDDDAPARRLQALRHAALEDFRSAGLPSSRDEDWRHTSLAPITRLRFAPPCPPPAALPTPAQLEPLLLAGPAGPLLTFVDGRFVPGLSRQPPVPAGVTVADLGAALRAGDPSVGAHLARHAACGERPFAALNTAFLDGGALVRVESGQALAMPVQVLSLRTPQAAPTHAHPRLLLVAEEQARVAVIESHAGWDEGAYLTNAVSELVVQPGAHVEHVLVQQEGPRACHVHSLHVLAQRQAVVRSTCFTLAGGLVRNQAHVELAGEDADATLDGLFLTSGQQHVDNHTLIEHGQPRGRSHEHYKGVLAGRSRGVFRGRILVHPGAQQTDAYQACRSLLLSDLAQVNAKPQLEIYADDVKCSHGATVGQLDPDAIFYLRSRGIGPVEARGLLTRAFAAQIVAQVGLSTARARLEELVAGRLDELVGGAGGGRAASGADR